MNILKNVSGFIGVIILAPLLVMAVIIIILGS